MTEVEQTIRAIRRWCRGPMLLSAKEQAEWRDRWITIEATRDLIAGITLKEELEKRLKTSVEHPRDFEHCWRQVAQLIYAHQDLYGMPCGQDVNALIIEDGQFDGELHWTTCPKCGTQHNYRLLIPSEGRSS